MMMVGQASRIRATLVIAQLFLANVLIAASFHPIAGITSSTSATDLFPVANLIEESGSGYASAVPHDQLAGAGRWVTDACAILPCDYLESFAPPVIVVDLGVDQPLDEISLWGYDASNTNGAREVQLRFATDTDGTSSFGTAINYNPTLHLLNDDTVRQSFRFRKTVHARYIQLTITDNFFGTGPGGDRVGLGEIAFAVPSSPVSKLVASAPTAFQLVGGDVTNSTLSDLLSGHNIWSTVIDPATGDVLVSLPTDASLARIDVDAVTPILTPFGARVGAVFHGLAYDHVTESLWVLDSNTDTLELYDFDTGSYTVVATAFQRPNEVVYDAKRDWLIVTDSGLDVVLVYDLAGNVLHELGNATTVGAWGIVVDPVNGDILYSSHDRGEIRRWVPGRSTSSLEYASLEGPRGLGYDRWGRLYCVQGGNGEIKTIEPAPSSVYSTALGGRDIALYADCDLDGDFLPDAWEATHGGLAMSFTSDPDADGLVAGFEAATGGSASDGSDSGLVSMDTDGIEMTIDHLSLLKSDLQYTLMLSNDLVYWTPASTLGSTEAFDSIYERRIYRFNIDQEGFANGERVFAKIDVESIER